MKQRHHSPEQIIRKLAEGDKMLNEGHDIAEVCRHLAIAKSTWHRWRAQYMGAFGCGQRARRQAQAQQRLVCLLGADRNGNHGIIQLHARPGRHCEPGNRLG